MQLTADSRLLRRAERITPLPYIKQPRPEGWAIPEPVEEPAAEPASASSAEPPPESTPQPVLESPLLSDPTPVSEPKVLEEVMDDFGTNLDLPPEPPRESESA